MPFILTAFAEPIGSIKHWIRPNNTIPLPGGWLICDGSTVSDPESPFDGLVLPDLRGKFPRGHATLDNGNFAADTLYFAGGTVPTGGADLKPANHSHAEPAHSHASPTHDHDITPVDHTHALPAVTGTTSAVGIAPVAGVGGTGPGVNGHDHNFVGSSLGSGPALTDTTTTDVFTVDSGGPGSSDTALSAAENRPVFDELLTIIKIK